MKRLRLVASLAAISLLLVLQLTASTAGAKQRNFTAVLTGEQEVQTPPVETDAQGQATFQLRNQGTELRFTLSVSNIENVVAAHLHLAPAAANGPIVVGLFGGPATGPVNGVLAEGTITASDLVGPLQGQSLSVLVDEIRARHIYVNVHTEVYLAGEIRGQLR